LNLTNFRFIDVRLLECGCPHGNIAASRTSERHIMDVEKIFAAPKLKIQKSQVGSSFIFGFLEYTLTEPDASATRAFINLDATYFQRIHCFPAHCTTHNIFLFG